MEGSNDHILAWNVFWILYWTCYGGFMTENQFLREELKRLQQEVRHLAYERNLADQQKQAIADLRQKASHRNTELSFENEALQEQLKNWQESGDRLGAQIDELRELLTEAKEFVRHHLPELFKRIEAVLGGEVIPKQEIQAIVSEFFQGDAEKINAWWYTANPLLGDVKPAEMIGWGRDEKLLKVVKNWREREMPNPPRKTKRLIRRTHMKFTPEDFYKKGFLSESDACEIANTKLAEWLEKAPEIELDRSDYTFSNYLDDMPKEPLRHKARLVCIEEIKKK